MELRGKSFNENCFVCCEYMGDFKNEMSICTTYSEKPIFEILESFINNRVKLSDDEIFNCGICQSCFIKFNEFDEHLALANKIQEELTQLYENCSDIEFDQTKTEAKDDSCSISEVMMENFIMDSTSDAEETHPQDEDQYEHELDNIADDDIYSKDNRVKRQYRRKKNLDEGLIVVEVDGVKIYQCEICKKLCKDRYKLKAHKAIHTTERRICCNECGALFKTLTCLYSHKKIHRERVYHYCDLCDMRYIQKTQLRKHILAIHLKRKDHVCSICGKCYSRDTTLSKHMFVHKPDERHVVCNICGFATHTKPKLDRHMKSHTGERNYECNICSKKFLYSYNVTAHIRHVHNREKRKIDEEKLKCKFCGKKFQKIWKVKEHMSQTHNYNLTEELEFADIIEVKQEEIN